MNRRQWLGHMLLLSTLHPPLARAFTVLRTLGPASPEYLHRYFLRMAKWYDREFANLSQNFNRLEAAFLPRWLDHLSTWGFPVSDAQLFEHFTFSHRIVDGQVNHLRLAIGLSQWPEALRQEALTLLKAREVHLLTADTPSFFGLGWDFAAQQTKAYFLHSRAQDVGDSTLREWSLVHDETLWHGPRLSCLTFQSGKLIRKKLIVSLRHLDWSKISTEATLDATSALKIISSDVPVRWHFRLRSLFFPALSPVSHPILAKHAGEFQQLGHSLLHESSQRYTLYYP